MSKISWVLYPIIAAVALVLVGCPSPADTTEDPKPGNFSVVLSGRAKSGSTAVVTSGTPGDTQVLGIGAKTNAVTAVPGTALEVWLTNETYVTPSTGVPKNNTDPTPAAYKIYWASYDPSMATATNLTVTTAANDKVLIDNAVSGTQEGRKKVIVGSDLLDKAGGAVVVAYVFPATVTAWNATTMGPGKDNAGKLAEYKLTITKNADTALNFTGRTVSAKGLAMAAADTTAPTAAATGGAVTVATAANTATLQLATASAGTNVKIVFDGFALDKPEYLLTAAIAGNSVTAVDANSVTGAAAVLGVYAPTPTLTAATASAPASAKAEFTIAKVGDTGTIKLTYQDHKGLSGTLVVKLDPNKTT